LLGKLVVPAASMALDSTTAAHKKLLDARKADSTAMCLLRILLTDKISQSALYNSNTTELPGGSAEKAWDNLHKLFYHININKMNELKGEIVISTLYKDDINPDEWFADLYSLSQRLTDDYKLTTFGDEEMMNQIIYNTKPQYYQMQLTVIKDRLAMEVICFENDNNYVKEVTLESVQVNFREIYATIQASQTRGHSKDTPVMLMRTTKKKFPTQFKKNCSLCGKQGHKSVDCYSRSENAHKKPGYAAAALTTTSSTPKADIACHYCHKKGHTEKQCFKKKREDKSEGYADGT
jgi:hypothetical protein